jgi:hypothetical protein
MILCVIFICLVQQDYNNNDVKEQYYSYKGSISHGHMISYYVIL